ncbi:TPA: glycosyltransferase family 1 protein [Candidatus Poribacteria bacterium]|nr:glycosyltransferase family 1 protein [Candidatus Poribacteria bacterium]
MMPQKLRVLQIITRLDKGGAPEVVMLLAEKLNKEKISTQIISGLTIHPQQDIDAYEKRTGVQIHFIPSLRRQPSLVKDVLALITLYLAIRRINPDIVHTHTSKAGILGRIAAALCKVPIIIHSPHGHVFYGYFGRLQNSFILLVERLTALLTDRIITLTQQGKRDHVRARIAPPEKFVPIHCGIDLSRFSDVEVSQKEKRQELNIPEFSPIVGTVSRLEPIKGQEYFIQSSALVARKYPDTTFVVVGDGLLEAKLKQMANDLGIRKNLLFLGYRQDVPELMSIFDIFVLPSLNEGLGRVLIEAMAAGKPVVATRVGGIPDVVLDEVTGLLAPPRNSHRLAEFVLRLLENKDLAHKMGRAGKIRAAAFDVRRMVEKTETLYQQLAMKLCNAIVSSR